MDRQTREPDADVPGSPNLSDLFPGNGERHHMFGQRNNNARCITHEICNDRGHVGPGDAILPDGAL
jgi:hypothetical protein